MKNYRKLFPLFLGLILLNSVCISSCKKESNEEIIPDDKPTVVKSYLSFEESSANDLQLTTEAAYRYKIITSGGDPYIRINALKAKNADEKLVLTFDYKSSAAISPLQIFLAPPLSEGQSVKSQGMTVSDEWKTFSIDLGDYIAEYEWGQKGHFMRLDFGSVSGITIHIKNMYFRERTEAEQALADARADAKEKDRVLTEKLKKYHTASFDAAITNVNVSTSKIKISGNCKGQSNLLLCEVPPYQNLHLLTKFNNGIAINNQDFTIELDRYVEKDGFNYDRSLSQWVIVKSGTSADEMMSFAHYPDNIEAIQNMKEGVLKGKKGLGGFAVGRGFTQDLDDLQIASVTVNIPITAYMYLQPTANTFEHTYGGKTYYFNKAGIEMLDKTLQKAYEKNIMVAAILLIQKTPECADPEIGALLQHPTFTDKGIYSMPNMTSSAALNCYAAALDFLASRYSRTDNAYGRIHYWIMHNEVDAGITWTNMGDRPMAVFMDTYIKSMRLCYSIARNYDAHSQVLASFTHSWKEASETAFYVTTEMIDFLKKNCNAEGDFQWGLAYHSYPEDLTEPKTWKDSRATFSASSPLVTFKNLEVLDKWTQKTENKYKGETKRLVWLSENGTNSRTYGENDLKEQAAGLAYAWKKIEALDGIDAIQWHNWIDNRAEGGLKIGLRRFPDDETEPGGEKPVWYVYKAAGTDQEDVVFDQYKSVIGINNWDDIMHDLP